MSAPTLEETIAFAVEKYTGHKPDKGGSLYVLHALRVMLAMATDEERRVAVLHDVVEDCGVTLEDLRTRHYPEREIDAIDALSRRKAGPEQNEETYEDFIERVRPNALARKVKLADLADNMDVRRLADIDAKTCERLARYLRAWKKLMASDAET